MICSRCGTKNEDNSTVCSMCNNSLVVNTVKKDNTKKKQAIVIGILLFIIAIMGGVLVSQRNEKLEDEEHEKLLESGNNSRTIMIYMVGSNLESDAQIATSDIASIKEDEVDLENVNVLLYTGGTTKWHNFVSSEENAIYELTKNGFEKVKTYKKENMGDADTLTTFLEYGYDNYKTDRYDLIFYDHGGAIHGAIYDDFTNDNLSLKEFKTALANSDFNKKNKIEVVLFRTCLNGTLEVANTFKDYAHYLVASEEVTIGGSISSVLNFINDIEVTDTPIDYGKKFISAYEKQVEELDPFGMSSVPMYSIIDLADIDSVTKELNKFIKGIDITDNYNDIVRVRSELFQYGYSFYGDASYDMVDLHTLVEGIDDYSSVDSEKLLKAIDEAVEYNWSTLDESHGLSIFFPYKGSKEIQNGFLSIYKDFDVSDNYTTFIKKFYTLSTSNKQSSFSKSNLVSNDTSVSKNEFTLELTSEQARDYAESFYIVFERQDNDYFMPIYSSDNTKLVGNKLKTNVTNNLIKMYDHSDGSSAYVQLTERSKGDKKNLRSVAILFDYSDGFDTEAVELHYDYKDNKPYVSNVSIIDKGDAISTRFVDLKDYDTIQITNYRYKILDENGKYNPNWEGEPTKYLFEVNLKNKYEFINNKLEDGDYYAIFCVRDVYGNSFYSNLVSMNK